MNLFGLIYQFDFLYDHPVLSLAIGTPLVALVVANFAWLALITYALHLFVGMQENDSKFDMLLWRELQSLKTSQVSQ